MKAIFSLIFCFCFVLIRGQESNVIKERAAFKLKIPVDKGSVYEADIPASPYMNGPNVLQLYPGEKVFVEVDEYDGTIKSMTVVKQNKNPKQTLEISFTQNAEKDKHQNMTLQIDNPFPMDLSYSANILLMKTNKWAKTKVLPVDAKLSSIEMWPDVVISIGLGDWAFKKKE